MTGKDVPRGAVSLETLWVGRGNALVNEGRASGLAYGGENRLVSAAIIEYLLFVVLSERL